MSAYRQSQSKANAARSTKSSSQKASSTRSHSQSTAEELQTDLNHETVRDRSLTPPDFRGLSHELSSPLHVQAKLKLGQADDPYEREADRMADAAVRSLNGGTAIAPPPSRTTVPNSGIPVPSSIEQQIEQARGGGRPLPSNLRESMEQAFGADFSGVRVHTGDRANQLNVAINARAFTTGQHLFFKQGEYSPNSGAGQRLLAHELSHITQHHIAQPSCSEQNSEPFHADQTPIRRVFDLDAVLEESLKGGNVTQYLVDLLLRKKNGNLENLLFLLEVQDFKNNQTDWQPMKQAQSIIKDYVHEESPLPINVGNAHRLRMFATLDSAIQRENVENLRTDLFSDMAGLVKGDFKGNELTQLTAQEKTDLEQMLKDNQSMASSSSQSGDRNNAFTKKALKRAKQQWYKFLNPQARKNY
ncbi:DUF4157 domain-containing protein [Pseudanabaenaceae cyanobacterium LEGE 13415]|nr:DUF4157 domain-containing protein [Pseudanabaenaceae cyanobacterium LEGE 13415]